MTQRRVKLTQTILPPDHRVGITPRKRPVRCYEAFVASCAVVGTTAAHCSRVFSTAIASVGPGGGPPVLSVLRRRFQIFFRFVENLSKTFGLGRSSSRSCVTNYETISAEGLVGPLRLRGRQFPRRRSVSSAVFCLQKEKNKVCLQKNLSPDSVQEEVFKQTVAGRGRLKGKSSSDRLVVQCPAASTGRSTGSSERSDIIRTLRRDRNRILFMTKSERMQGLAVVIHA